jgi:hypothetical protein
VTTWLSYLIELHRKKDAVYGDAWCRRGETAGIFPNIARKYDRWTRIRHQNIGTKASVEPLDDTLADLLIYAVKYLLWLLERHPSSAHDLPAKVAADASVADILTLVAQMPVIENPAEAMVVAFEQLEEFLSGVIDDRTAGDRAIRAWSLARGAWAELCTLPEPDADEPSGSVQPLLVRTGSLATTQHLYDQLLAVFAHAPGTILLLGLTPVALELRAELWQFGLRHYLLGIVHPGLPADESLGVLDWSTSNKQNVDYLVVASDEDKEELLHAYTRVERKSTRLPTVIITGVAHLAFRDPLFAELDAPALVPSYATGYPYTRVHMFQHLHAAAANGLWGAIVEFGAFKGGTTAWLAAVARRLNLDVPVLAFDSWDGFPPRRSVLDMYAHPRCVFSDIGAVRAYLEPMGVELVPGDISDTAPRRLAELPILLAFIDTDNYSPAAAALTALVGNVVPGGAIVFDHYTTTQEYLYTLGERMAALDILKDRGFLQVHGTGVFVRLPTADVAKSKSASNRHLTQHGEGAG